MEAADQRRCSNAFSCELEDWFHILDSDGVPGIEQWSSLPLYAEKSIERLLALFDAHSVKATFFCLGWMAERMPRIIRRCQRAGHEIASHGYGHVLAYQVGRKGFLNDIVRAKKILEDITGEEVAGFRAPGFSVRNDNPWVFEVVVEAGYRYDASVFPAHHGHGGLSHAEPGAHLIRVRNGPLVEIPASTVRLLGRRVCLFGGGYLRITPLPLIRWGVKQLHQEGRPLIVYIHPREIDPGHPRLPLPLMRRFKCYVNLRSTLPKVKWLCEHYEFTTMKVVAGRVASAGKQEPLTVPVAPMQDELMNAAVADQTRTMMPEKVGSSQWKGYSI